TLTFHASVTGTTGGLTFTATPAIDSSGNLTYQTAPDRNRTSVVNVIIVDNGGTANSGNDTSPTQTFNLTVNPVNDPPSFTLNGNPPTINEDASPQTVNGVVTNRRPGPATATDEAGQTLTLHISVTATTGGLTFTAAPAIDSSGNLTYQTAPD